MTSQSQIWQLPQPSISGSRSLLSSERGLDPRFGHYPIASFGSKETI
jgi:hypothetical protein